MPATSHCPSCGSPTVVRERGGRPRATCPGCGLVLWQNPKAAVAVILRDEAGRVLLVRRTGTSYPGAWCIPCGNIEWDEDVREAARREMLEESGWEVELGRVYAVLSNFHDPQAHSVGVWFDARRVGGVERPGGDAGEVGWFDPRTPPEPLAFPTDRIVLEALAAGKPSV